jgi:hypothetical protein
MDLDVPYAEKDAAKALGARWDSTRRCWYVPEGLDPASFLRWVKTPPPSAPASLPGLNLRAPEAYVVTAPRRCWKCGEPTLVAGFLMAPGFQDFSVWEDDLDGEGHWGGGEGWRYAHHIEALPSPVAAQAIAHAPRYRHAYSRTTQSAYWGNHCSSCRALQGDFHLFEEPGAPFLPWRIGDLAGQRAHRLKGVFEAAGAFGHAIDLALQIPGVRAGAPTGSSTAGRPAPTKAIENSIWRKVRRWLSRGGGA